MAGRRHWLLDYKRSKLRYKHHVWELQKVNDESFAQMIAGDFQKHSSNTSHGLSFVISRVFVRCKKAGSLCAKSAQWFRKDETPKYMKSSLSLSVMSLWIGFSWAVIQICTLHSTLTCQSLHCITKAIGGFDAVWYSRAYMSSIRAYNDLAFPLSYASAITLTPRNPCRWMLGQNWRRASKTTFICFDFRNRGHFNRTICLVFLYRFLTEKTLMWVYSLEPCVWLVLCWTCCRGPVVQYRNAKLIGGHGTSTLNESILH